MPSRAPNPTGLPLNPAQVKLIPPKEQSEMFGRYREPACQEDESDSYSSDGEGECDNQVLRESIRRSRP